MGRPALTAKDILLVLLSKNGRITVPGRYPNMASLFAPLVKSPYTKPQLTRAVYRLRKLRLLKVQRVEDDTVIRLTPPGQRQALRYASEDIELDKPYRWNGQWHMVMFDIPNTYRVARNALRERMKRLGLVPLQESVWITPNPCREEIKFLAQMLNIGPFVKTLVVTDLDEYDAKRLKEKFSVR